jgi:hypothetical protein
MRQSPKAARAFNAETQRTQSYAEKVKLHSREAERNFARPNRLILRDSLRSLRLRESSSCQAAWREPEPIDC